MNDWIKWRGGEDPRVPCDTPVEVKFPGADVDDSQLAGLVSAMDSQGHRKLLKIKDETK